MSGRQKVHTKLAEQAAAERKAAVSKPIGKDNAVSGAAKGQAYIGNRPEPTEAFSDAELKDRLACGDVSGLLARRATELKAFTGNIGMSMGRDFIAARYADSRCLHPIRNLMRGVVG